MVGFLKVGDQIKGMVKHHNDHIVGYETDEDGNEIPIYCEGHEVTGVVTSGSKKVSILGQSVACEGDEGTTDCECDREGFVLKGGHPKITIEGVPVMLDSAEIDIHGHGTGKVVIKESKVTVGG